MNDTEKLIRRRLFELEDKEYRDFQSGLMPTIDKELIIGVRVPALRKLSKELSKTPLMLTYLQLLPHMYYEENNLHAFLIESINDYSVCIEAIDRFLPYVDNWATCDMLSPKVLKKHPDDLLVKINEWLSSGHTYTVRFAVKCLMNYFLDSLFDDSYLETVAGIKSEEYYINMMIAWYFATALAKQYEPALRILKERRLDSWVHNKAIQKAIESRRISTKQKEILKKLKIK